jgi:hypothetical protein
MSNKDLLSEFLDDDYFKQTVTLITKITTRVGGRVEATGTNDSPIDGIIQSVKEKDLVNAGLGQYTSNQAYSFFTKTIIDQSLNNLIRFEGKLFKLRKVSAWNRYGFNKYIIYQYNDEVLNDR